MKQLEPMTAHQTIAIIVAAGRGTRAGPGGPKQYRQLGREMILAHTARAFINHERIDGVRVIIHRDDHDIYDEALAALAGEAKLMSPVNGGAERQDSVRLGLESLEEISPSVVLIHDGARPFVDHATISRVIDACADNDGAIAALRIHDTLKRGGDRDCITDTLSRDGIWRAQTPQGFQFTKILSAHRDAAGKALTDDGAVGEQAGLTIKLVDGAPDNMKITQAEDFGMAEILLQRKSDQGSAMQEFRTGNGYDVHAFEPGDAVILCGVKIDHGAKLKGHSDADVGMHALTDALFGALAAGDIGDHFPPSDLQWKGAASEIFLKKAGSLVRERGGQITHCDITLVCEAPKIGPHRDAMQVALAAILEIDKTRVSVKAKTTEKLGFTGREEGIAALATATVRLPSHD